MPTHRLYIDESGDHSYRSTQLSNRRYLGLTGVLIRQDRYSAWVPYELEALKRRFFKYDPDSPPILTRKQVIQRRSWFGVLRDPAINAEWEKEILAFYAKIPAQFFTVVIDKAEHYARYPVATYNPYEYSLAVLLNRVRGYLKLRGATADVMPESRGQKEDNQLLAAYVDLRTNGAFYGTGPDYQESFPESGLLFRRKDQNVAGLQLADLIAAEQTLLTAQEAGKPMPRAIGSFGQRMNDAIRHKVNQYGRYFLE